VAPGYADKKTLFNLQPNLHSQANQERDRERIKEWKKEKIKIDNDDRM